ncbi:MAG TPA: peptidase C39 [Desulfobacteraceae bacterium]|nr:C39 family peptidase [Deltaproteobacteria bacterium]MBW2356150.1 C39 family peptidase [Deltaproteobacteria bacterium]RLB95877.1 MAG: peptidase C39 [Deltaproteobacteria bacterium]HDI59364.1 peptidase C39 [Desulfobacteraceae bacterium]
MKQTCLLAILLCLGWTGHPEAEVIEEVPFFEQQRHQCGAAALATVLAYYDRLVPPDQISQEIYNETLRGALLPDLENYAARLGFKTESGQGTLARLKESVLARKPVIVLIDNGVWLASRPHYIVVFGFNEEGFIAHDGNRPAVLIGYEAFQKRWQKMGAPYLLVYP